MSCAKPTGPLSVNTASHVDRQTDLRWLWGLVALNFLATSSTPPSQVNAIDDRADSAMDQMRAEMVAAVGD